MNISALLDLCEQHFILLSREGDYVKAEAQLPDTHPLPDELSEQVRRHTPALLSWLDFEAAADALLLASTRRLAAAWPEGCELEGEVWETFEELLARAYRAQDLAGIRSIIHEREQFALGVFSAHIKEDAA